MKLIDINDPALLCESSETEAVTTWMFKYLAKRDTVVHRHPHIVFLGIWNHVAKGTKQKKGTQNEQRKYAGGINLNYLNQQQRADLRAALPEILEVEGLQARYRAGARLLPHIFRGPKFAAGQDTSGLPPSGAYRTYRLDSNDGIKRHFDLKKGRLLVLKISPEDRLKAQQIADEEGRDWDDLSPQERSQYEEQAFRERGVEDEKRRERAEKDRELLEPASDLEEPGPSRDDEIDVPDSEKEEEPEPTTEPPPGPRRLAAPDPGPGIEVSRPAPAPTEAPKTKGKTPMPQQQISPTRTGGTHVAMPDPQRLRVKDAAPPSTPTDVTSVATQNPNAPTDDDDRPD